MQPGTLGMDVCVGRRRTRDEMTERGKVVPRFWLCLLARTLSALLAGIADQGGWRGAVRRIYILGRQGR